MVGLVIVVANLIVSAIVGLFVVLQDIRRPINIVYGLLSLAFLTIGLANYMTVIPSDDPLLFMRIVVAATSIAIGLLYLMAHLLGSADPREVIRMKSVIAVLCGTALIAIVDFTPLVFSGLVADAPMPTPQPAFGASLFFAHFVITVGMSLVALFRGMRSTKGAEHAQYLFVLIGIAPILMLAPVTSFVMPVVLQITDYIILSPLYTTFFVVMVAYAIVRHRLFDIKFAVVRTTAYLGALLTFAATYYLVAYVLTLLLIDDNITGDPNVNPIFILPALVLAFLFQPVKRLFDRLTNSLFYRDRYSSEEFVGSLSNILSSTIDLRSLLISGAKQISSTFKAEQALFIVYLGSDHHMSAGTTGHSRVPIPDARLLDAYVEKTNEKIFLSDWLTDHDIQLRRMLMSHGIELVMPLWHKEKVMGYVLLGDHRSGHYTKRDLQVLEAVSNELVIAILNAMSLHEVRELNATLQQRINVATKELRSSNSQLKHLDEIKDEFISMASHQLRTPLTSVKGYLSMVLDGDAGNVTPRQQKLLLEAYNSSERMVRLIADFLNVSRLQTGKFIIDKELIDMKQIVHQEVDDLVLIAKAHKIKFRLDIAKHEIPVVADGSKIQQVIMNFIDNAIYYSRQDSTVIIKLEQVKGDVAFTVVDTGIGVPEEDQPKLFHKFYRAANARKQRPDGTGVGLFMARRVIEAHGGKIIFSSREGRGSTFGFRIPMSKDGVK